jgi:hypothetical protein
MVAGPPNFIALRSLKIRVAHRQSKQASTNNGDRMVKALFR